MTNWLNEIRESPPKTAVIAEIDAVRKLITQNSHVTYREIELSLGISPTNIHSILHEHLAVKNFLLAESRIRSKKAIVDWCIEMLEKYYGI